MDEETVNEEVGGFREDLREGYVWSQVGQVQS